MLKSTDVFLSLGRRGSGKSYLARKLSSAYPRKVVFDSLGEYSDDDGIIVCNFDEFCQKILETQNSHAFTIIFQFDPESETHVDEFNQALRILWHRGNVLILIEEIQLYSSPHSMCLWLKNCLLTGRHRNVGLIFTTQRPGECNKTIISQSNHVFCGSLHEKNDIEYTKSILGESAYSLSSLPERQFLYFRPGQSLTLINNNLEKVNKN
jgi:hypothetical protein